jgi:hypothetical protein
MRHRVPQQQPRRHAPGRISPAARWPSPDNGKRQAKQNTGIQTTIAVHGMEGIHGVRFFATATRKAHHAIKSRNHLLFFRRAPKWTANPPGDLAEHRELAHEMVGTG